MKIEVEMGLEYSVGELPVSFCETQLSRLEVGIILASVCRGHSSILIEKKIIRCKLLIKYWISVWKARSACETDYILIGFELGGDYVSYTLWRRYFNEELV